MSSSETEGSELPNNTKRSHFKIIPLKDLETFQHETIISYIEKLHAFLKKKEKKLKKCREKISSLLKQVEHLKEGAHSKAHPLDPPDAPQQADTQCDNAPKDDTEEASNASEAFNFVDEMRQAAEQAQNLNGLVYEPTSGLYYDQKSGYYYNAEYGLYYDGNTGCYYSYNQTKKTYEFHSQVQVQSTQEVNGGEKNKKHHKSNSSENYAGDNVNVDNDDAVSDGDEVLFDESGGVITDKVKLKQIKVEKEKLKKANDRHRRHQKKKKHQSKHKHSASKNKHKAKKRKRKHRKAKVSSDAETDSDEPNERQTKRKKRPKKDVEDGELSTSSSSSSSSSTSSSSSSSDSDRDSSNIDSHSESEGNVQMFHKVSRFQDIAKKYPPSLRIIVQETNLENLTVGSLSLITFKGGSLGREGSHDVIIPDVNVSKCHLQFKYDTKHSIYKCIDLGSRNGTILNGVRISVAKSESEAHDLVHGSIIQIGQTKLLCHVHEGNSTCGLCEPGLLIEAPPVEASVPVATVTLSHKEQLKKLQKKYGLENEKFVESKQGAAGNYNDRAATRRIQVGSSTDKEKTQTASVDTAITSENKGFKMLSKLGWNKGQALGKTNANTGLLEPINVASNEGKKGLGCDDPTAGLTLTAANKKKMHAWKKTQERYRKTDLFADADDDDDIF